MKKTGQFAANLGGQYHRFFQSYVYTTTPLGKEIKKENLELMNIARSILKVATERKEKKVNEVENAKKEQMQTPKDNTINFQSIRYH